MQELEKILEEVNRLIEKHKNNAYELVAKEPLTQCYTETDIEQTKVHELAVVRDIIRKYMNDGWIPVEERMPEDGTYLCTLKGELCGIEEPFTGMCGIENGICDEPDCVIAWRPLPEPYIPRNQNKPEDHYPDRACARSLNAKK